MEGAFGIWYQRNRVGVMALAAIVISAYSRKIARFAEIGRPFMFFMADRALYLLVAFYTDFHENIDRRSSCLRFGSPSMLNIFNKRIWYSNKPAAVCLGAMLNGI